MGAVSGPDAPARRFLIAACLAIAILGTATTVAPAPLRSAHVPAPPMVRTVCDLASLPLLGLAQPVILTDLAVVRFHCIALATIA